MAWERLVAKYEPHTAPSYLDRKNISENSALVSIDEGPNEWITELESLRAQMNDTKFSAPIIDRDFLIIF